MCRTEEEGPFEVRRVDQVERIGPSHTDTGELKRMYERVYELDGALIEQSIVQYARLWCGHITKPVASCICGNRFCQ